MHKMSRIALSLVHHGTVFVRHDSLQMHWPPKSARLYTVNFWIALGGQYVHQSRKQV